MEPVVGSADDDEEEGVLRSALMSLQHCLVKFGLVPSRVIAFMRPITTDSDDSVQFPTTEMRGTLIRHEISGAMELSVLSFMEILLGDDAPPHALSSFTQALFDANNDPRYPNANEAAWRVHDIITLACAYMPLQQSLLAYLGQGQGHDVDIQAVVTEMSNRRLLKPEHTSYLLETLEVDGAEAAVVSLLASLYAARVDMLKDEYNEWQAEGGASGASAMLEPPWGDSPFWLNILVQSVEARGGQGFSQTVPEAVMSADTWAAVYDRLAYGRRGRMERYEDARSEAGESVASDTTLVDLQEYDEDTQHLTDRKRRSAREELDINFDQDTRRKQTEAYVLGKCIPNMLLIFDHDPQPRHRVEPRSPTDADECSSVITTSSISTYTENNSHVRDDDDNDSIVHACLWEIRESRRQVNLLGDGQITLRDYQEELLCWAREGKNVAIFLPTGTGKTYIVLKYVQEHLSRPGLNRVVFLAPKVKLAEQQYQRFRQYFPQSTYFRCGRSRSSLAPFSELLDTYKVFVMTPQCLVEAVQRKEVKITDFSILVMDECHHVGQGKHACKVLMGLYMDVKYAEGGQPGTLPQVIGLTASPGIGQGGTLENAVAHIKELCYSMDIEKICTVTKHKRQLEYFVNEPQHEIHKCQRRKHDRFKKIIEDIMEQIEGSMLQCLEREWRLKEEEQKVGQRILTAPALHRGRPQYNHWVFTLENTLVAFSEYKDTYKKLFSLGQMLVIYQRCLILNEDCESQYALDYLLEQIRALEDQVPQGRIISTERTLLDQFNGRLPELRRACGDPEDYNPKLIMLEDILLGVVEKNQEDCACMVFVRTLELTKAIQHWLMQHPQLSHLNPGRMTGTKRAATDGGMTRQEVSDVMAKFNAGDHKVVVCTSAAEEGLDFQACSVVVRYDHVTNMISMIQTRGRARRKESQYCVVGSLTQGNLDKERENLALERLMNQALTKVRIDMETNPNAFLNEMTRWQRKDWEHRKVCEAIALERLKKVTSDTPFQLLCRKCQRPACLSTDFRLLEQSSRAVVAEDFRGKWKRVERGAVYQIKYNVDKIAKVHCNECNYDWGIVICYKPTGRELPVLKLESFFLVDTRTGVKLTKKLKWADAPFSVEDISEEELQ